MSTDPWQNLRHHPLVVVIGFCVATAGVVAAVYEKEIIPNQLKILEARVSELTKEVASTPKLLAERDSTIAKLEGDKAGLQRDNVALQREITSHKQRVLELSKENVFASDDPYPKTLRVVRIGDPISKVEQVYPGKVDKPEDTPWVTVKLDNDFFFGSVTYYFDESAKPHRVNMLLLFIRRDPDALRKRDPPGKLDQVFKSIDDDREMLTRVLKGQIVERYGTGTPVKKGTEWRVRGVKLTLEDKGTLSIDR